MADPRGFLNVTQREEPQKRPVPVRILDYREVGEKGDRAVLDRQAGRCMDCGVPFCHQGCPLGNLIPEFNDFTWRHQSRLAAENLLSTNNFPEFTGLLCPAPCESACVLGINQPAVTIKAVEQFIADEIFDNDWLEPHPPARLTGQTVAVIGSGPAGLAAAQQLTRAGHTVAVYERDQEVGGLLRYGIPDFKLEKRRIDARVNQMRAEGTRFRTGIDVGNDLAWSELRDRFDAVVVAIGAQVPRDLPIPGRELHGVHPAMDYLVRQNRLVAGEEVGDPIDAHGKHVVVLGGGDTGSDCIGTAHRQRAASVTNLAIGIKPPRVRPDGQPWPMHPNVFEVQSSHEEGGERKFLVSTVEFVDDGEGRVRALRIADTEIIDGVRRPEEGTEREIPADLVLLALGFTGVETDDALPISLDRGAFSREDDFSTSEEGVFVAGDAGRGSSLIVWAIAEGRAAAAAVDEYLTGSTILPAPVRASDKPIGAR
ncbi:glutamate synthase subunit beta [uncultured Agrococcus sp.]|uniref:glutamate synthase subunit beta n=1 Tax=uncultured Agrococcus sp. TaxID=382258 RepID=UPI0025D8693E|nr:glutamate synthase subunit beta [uncultured Agrococcus sp.]